MNRTRNEPKPWHLKYVEGVPREINPDAYASVVEVLEATCQRFKEKPAFSNLGCTLSFTEIDRLSRDFAAYLQSLPNLKPGDRIAVQLPNLLQFPIAVFGALRAGLVVVNTNPLYTAREMEFQFKDSGCKAVVICANFATHLEAILDKTPIQHVIVTEIGDVLPQPKRALINFVIKYVKRMVPKFNLPQAVRFNAALAEGAKLEFTPVPRKGSDLAFIQYTGGTTGVSKGAMLSHRNVVANMEQNAAWMRPMLKEGEEICITPLPMYHIFSFTVNCLTFFRYGTVNVLITNPRDLPAMIKEMTKWKFTLMTGVNTLFNGLMNHPDFKKLDCSHLKVSVAGAMALQRHVAERWLKLTGSHIYEGYGLTESSPVVCCNPPSGDVIMGTIGMPLPSTDLMIVDEEGDELPVGEVGEICVKGPQVMQGYWQRPDESALVLIGNGWLKTGDMAKIRSDGYVEIVDRKKDMIIISGFKVYPNEVEEVLAGHPKVLEVGVIGVPDEKSGEVVKAFVVKRDPSLTEKEVLEYAKTHLTSYKIPKQIVFIPALPKTPVGKVLRRELR